MGGFLEIGFVKIARFQSVFKMVMCKYVVIPVVNNYNYVDEKMLTITT